MSYCVNCGVKLKNSEKECPLCHTKVINPNIDINKVYKPNYPNKVDNRKKINIKYLFKLILISFIAMSILLLGFDYIYNSQITYSIYLVLSILYLTSLFQYLFLKNIYLAHLINILSSLLFCFILCLLLNSINTFKYILLPIVLVVLLYAVLITFLIKNKKMNMFLKVSLGIVYICIILLAIECGVDYFINSKIDLHYSIISSIPLLVISLILFVISLNKKLVSEVTRRLFI